MHRRLAKTALGILLLVALAGLAGCAGDDPADVAGTWNGRRFNDNGETAFTLVLTQSGSSVSGSYTDGGWAGVIAGQVDGTDVELTLTLTTVPPGSPLGIWTFSGEAAGDAMSGTLQAGANLMNWECTR